MASDSLGLPPPPGLPTPEQISYVMNLSTVESYSEQFTEAVTL